MGALRKAIVWEKGHPKKLEILLSASEKKSLEKEEILECLELTSKDQVESSKPQIYVERVWQALEPFQQIAAIAARADPHRIAPYVVASSFLLIQVLRSTPARAISLGTMFTNLFPR